MHGFESRLALEPSISVSTVLKLVGQAYRSVRRQGGSRIDAELAALESYGTLRPDAQDAEARAAVAMLIKASSEAGLIWTEN
jgi:hypothetical protein